MEKYKLHLNKNGFNIAELLNIIAEKHGRDILYADKIEIKWIDYKTLQLDKTYKTVNNYWQVVIIADEKQIAFHINPDGEIIEEFIQ